MTREITKKSSGVSTEVGENGEVKVEEEIPVCELCSKTMALKKGRFGSFYGCTGYPECKNIRKISRSGEVKTVIPPVEIV